jgi:hypothetical protein
MMTTHVTMMVIQERHNYMLSEHQTMTFIPLIIETYGCFYFRFDSFLTICTQTISVSSMIFFSPLDACCLLLIAHVHIPIACTSRNDSSMGCCTWLRFLIFSTHHN